MIKKRNEMKIPYIYIYHAGSQHNQIRTIWDDKEAPWKIQVPSGKLT